ncbi:MAG: DUF2341 domain-containing protein [Chitinispirillaceae bacterium]|nr:DUF2341 domain-containing protein [Chitinispirillaceae bacterium]
MKNRNGNILFILPLLLAAACATLDPGGSGTETTTGIVGTVINDQGFPEANAYVRLYPGTYDPVVDTTTIPVDTTDSLGGFSFLHIRSGDYSLQAVHPKSGNRALLSGIHVVPDSVVAAIGTLRVPGSITVFLPSGINNATGYVYIPGTTVFTFLNNRTDFVTLDSAPAGRVPEIIYFSTNDTARTTIRYDVQVQAGDTTEVRNPSWKYAHALTLNTSATGANVAGNVTGFPVLIRLSAGNFNFAQAHQSGADVRFAKADGAFFPHETERWDATNQRAEIWVKVDTVRGNDSTQFFLMYWGNAAAQEASNGAAVFDTADGFMGAWHLAGPGDATAPDATGNHYDGTPYGMGAAAAVDGMIGTARRFDGTSSYIALTGTAQSRLSFPENGTYTLSAWVYATAIDSAAHYVISKGNRNYNLDLSGYDLWEVYDFRSGAGWERNFAAPTAGEWKFLTGVRNGSDVRLYVDGQCADSTADIYGSPLVRTPDLDVQIGRRADSLYGYWNGMIDEVTIANSSRSADWIKLCYMNQREDDRLVRFDERHSE